MAQVGAILTIDWLESYIGCINALRRACGSEGLVCKGRPHVALAQVRNGNCILNINRDRNRLRGWFERKAIMNSPQTAIRGAPLPYLSVFFPSASHAQNNCIPQAYYLYTLARACAISNSGAFLKFECIPTQPVSSNQSTKGRVKIRSTATEQLWEWSPLYHANCLSKAYLLSRCHLHHARSNSETCSWRRYGWCLSMSLWPGKGLRLSGTFSSSLCTPRSRSQWQGLENDSVHLQQSHVLYCALPLKKTTVVWSKRLVKNKFTRLV